MSPRASWVDFGPENSFRGYACCLPGPRPGLLLVQEVWGVDAHIQDVAGRFATAGYAVLAPDLYSEKGQHPEALEDGRLAEAKQFLNTQPNFFRMSQPEKAQAMAGLPEAEAGRINQTLGQLFSGIIPSQPKHLEILSQGAAWLRSQPESKSAKLGVLGFCMGGGLAGLLACGGAGISASVIFYGQGIPKERMGQCACKVLAFYGETDSRLVEPLPEFEHDMQEAGKDLKVHVYPGAGHAFFNDSRPSYHRVAAKDSYARSLEFPQGEPVVKRGHHQGPGPLQELRRAEGRRPD